ncbi:unnamed protein product [Cylicocyclus nassatus]|uniref:Uncharacterized protein n=1 Tax=Cylicocyclus nassatus TaxID=53992 RepID=A0AA36H7W7_CYLNA|nr:unnamed protein product [Cylicocyclus nassatus]
MIRAAVTEAKVKGATPLEGLYEYLPTNTEELKKNECYAAGFAFAVRTADTVQLMKWDVLCALEKDCMAPPGAKLKCSFEKDNYRKYANCHRFAQDLAFNETKDVANMSMLLNVKRALDHTALLV